MIWNSSICSSKLRKIRLRRSYRKDRKGRGGSRYWCMGRARSRSRRLGRCYSKNRKGRCRYRYMGGARSRRNRRNGLNFRV